MVIIFFVILNTPIRRAHVCCVTAEMCENDTHPVLLGKRLIWVGERGKKFNVEKQRVASFYIMYG
jgi:hypothetical protein